MTFGGFLSGIFGLEMSFSDIGAAIAAFYADFLQLPGATAISELLSGEAAMLPAIFLIASLFLALFGKRMLSLFRFLLFLAVGYVIGISLLAPPINEVLPLISAKVVGIAAAVVLSVTSKFLYPICYLFAFGAAAYVLVGNTLALGAAAASVGAVVGVLLALIFKKYVEMIYTAFLGAYLAAESLLMMWDFTSGREKPWVPVLVITLTVGALSAVVQFRTRKRTKSK